MSGTADKTTAPAETLADALAAAHRMLDEDGWIDEVTLLDEDGEPDDFAQRVVRADDVRDALDRIEAAAVRERERLRVPALRMSEKLVELNRRCQLLLDAFIALGGEVRT